MTITVLLMSILTGQNHTVVAEYASLWGVRSGSKSTPESPYGERYQRGLYLFS